MPSRKQRLVFLDRWSRRDMGASVMRVGQLSDHMKTFSADRYEVSVAYVSRSAKPLLRGWLGLRYPDAVFVLSKYAAFGWTADDLVRLRRRCRGILVDYVDMPIANMLSDGVDVHLSTSRVGARLMTEFIAHSAAAGRPIHGQVATVLHNHDAAIRTPAPPPPEDHLAMAYLGSRDMTRTTPLADEMVRFLDASSVAAFRASVAELGAYNAHYCIRKSIGDEPGRIAKPFTKGITAAACGAVVLTDRGTDDAVELLGADYPFLTEDNSDASIDDGLHRLGEAFGGPEWRDAQDRMAALHAVTCHGAIACQLDAAIRSIG